MENAVWSVWSIGGDGGNGGDGGAGSNGMNGAPGSDGAPGSIGTNGVNGAPGSDGQPGSLGGVTSSVPEIPPPDPVLHLESAAFEALLVSIGGSVHQVETYQPQGVQSMDFWIL